jgi:hypothetical protein
MIKDNESIIKIKKNDNKSHSIIVTFSKLEAHLYD